MFEVLRLNSLERRQITLCIQKKELDAEHDELMFINKRKILSEIIELGAREFLRKYTHVKIHHKPVQKVLLDRKT